MKYTNCYIGFLNKEVFKKKVVEKIKISEKEIKIQVARKKWKEARDIAEKTLKEYKIKKGDFYKIQEYNKSIL